MNNTEKPSLTTGLDSQILQIINTENLEDQRAHLKKLGEIMGFDLMDCAAALLFLLQTPSSIQGMPIASVRDQLTLPLRQTAPYPIKMVRYRLNVGRHHQVTVEELKKVLIEESGVDKNNIAHVDIQDFYTLIELPDEMPPDIFQHLKSVEINHQKLEIRRVKNRRPKKYGRLRYGRHHRQQQVPQQHPESAGFSGKG
jgi:hypothetical protein